MREYTYTELKTKRESYYMVCWEDSNNKQIKIVEMDSDYLTNVLAKVHTKSVLAATYPLIDSFQQWNNIAYSVWADIIYAELQYRDMAQEKQHLELEWHAQLAKEREFEDAFTPF